MESDESLVERFQLAGDEEAFRALVERHRRDVYRLAYRVSGNHEDAHDLSQESFVRVYRSLKSFRRDSAFRTWLYRIVMNLSLNHLKKRGREKTSPLGESEELLRVEPSGLSLLLAGERSRHLKAAIDRLPPRQKQTLILKVFRELKYVEIASVMRCTVGTAKANFFHAVRALRRELRSGLATSPRLEVRP